MSQAEIGFSIDVGTADDIHGMIHYVDYIHTVQLMTEVGKRLFYY